MSTHRTVRIHEPPELPAEYASDVQRAIQLLRQVGCAEIYLFGSLVDGTMHPTSDIDIAVRGCPSDRFYYAVGKLVMELDHSVDLVDLDRSSRFTEALQSTGALVRVA